MRCLAPFQVCAQKLNAKPYVARIELIVSQEWVYERERERDSSARVSECVCAWCACVCVCVVEWFKQRCPAEHNFITSICGRVKKVWEEKNKHGTLCHFFPEYFSPAFLGQEKNMHGMCACVCVCVCVVWIVHAEGDNMEALNWFTASFTTRISNKVETTPTQIHRQAH